MTFNPIRANVTFQAHDGPTTVVFEPLGTDFTLQPGASVILDAPLEEIAEIKIVIWKSGLSVWLPFPSGARVLDADGTELDTL